MRDKQTKAGLAFVELCAVGVLLVAAFVIGMMAHQWAVMGQDAQPVSTPQFEVVLREDGTVCYTIGTTAVWYCTECGQWHLASEEDIPCS